MLRRYGGGSGLPKHIAKATVTSAGAIVAARRCNRFLQRFALQNQQAQASQTYVALVNEEIAGYYTLVVGSVEHEGCRRGVPGALPVIRFR